MRTVATLVLALFLVASAAQAAMPVLKTTRPVVSIREGDVLRRDSWSLAPEVDPDVYEAEVAAGQSVHVTFISDVDSIGFDVAIGSQYDFIIEHGKDRCATRIIGIRQIPAAVFDAGYRAAHQGGVSIEVPEVYELVNVAIALTPVGLKDRGLVYHDSDYYSSMRTWFEPFRGHRAVAAIQEALGRNRYFYSTLKMNGYAFTFDEAGRIVQSPIYDRTGFPSERRNSLRPFVPALQAFSDTSNFRAFFAAHRSTYASQIAFYADTADVEAMLSWLNRQFPGSSGYDSYKILFTPLVAYSQSATWLESNGFRELQAHVNFPYADDGIRRWKGTPLSGPTRIAVRGNIVFTELNHGYINPEAENYRDRVARAISHRSLWVEPERGPSYYGGIALFNEYVNWSLVSLRAIDLVPPKEQAPIFEMVDDMMVRGRGFPRFAAFNSFLVGLYRQRGEGETVADLYPRIIGWFEKENASGSEDATK